MFNLSLYISIGIGSKPHFTCVQFIKYTLIYINTQLSQVV